MQREQHQAHADEDAAQIPCPGAGAAAESDHASHQQDGSDHRDIERQQLNDQGRADIGAQHHRERGNQVQGPAGDERAHHQAGGSAAL